MLKLTERYPDRSEQSSANYPYGGPKDDSTSALKGTPWEAATMGEFVGMMSAIVAAAKITPTGNTETAVASDVLDAICSMEYYEHANYKANKSIVTGSDGNQYIALIDNGPRSTLVDPVGDTTGTWHQYPYKKETKNNIDYQYWFNGDVHLSGNFSITATKISFGNGAVFDGSIDINLGLTLSRVYSYGATQNDSYNLAIETATVNLTTLTSITIRAGGVAPNGASAPATYTATGKWFIWGKK